MAIIAARNWEQRVPAAVRRPAVPAGRTRRQPNPTRVPAVRFRWAMMAVAGALSGYLSASSVIAADDREAAFQLLSAAVESRAKIQHGEMEWQYRIKSDRKFPQLSDCEYRFHVWYDFPRNRIRVDCDQTCPNDDNLTYAHRFSRTDDRVLILPDDSRSSGYAVPPDDDRAVHGTPAVLYTDPRLLGLFSVPYSQLRNYSLAEIPEDVLSSEQCTVSQDGSITTITLDGIRGLNYSRTYRLDSDSGNMPVQIRSESNNQEGQPANIMESQFSWKLYAASDGGTVWIPIRAEMVHRAGERVDSAHEVTVTRVALEQSPEPATFTWASMNLADRQMIRNETVSPTQKKQWEAATASFRPWEASCRV